jgi:hypothetical protein
MRARLAILLLAVPGVAAAQRPQPAARGAASIMAADGMEIANAAARPKWTRTATSRS